jgi:hypothetical protein
MPKEFRAIQFADFTTWNRNDFPDRLRELLQRIQACMSPRCHIAFQSIFQVQREHIFDLYDAYRDMASRIGCVPVPNQFIMPKDEASQRKLHRAVSSLQITVDWHDSLRKLFSNPPNQKSLIDKVRRVERHIPLIWLRMLSYSGPFTTGEAFKTHEKFLCFASMMLFYDMYGNAMRAGKYEDIPESLIEAQLKCRWPRWECLMSAAFDDADDMACAYVTHVDGHSIGLEEVYYGPKYHLQKAYGRSLRRDPYTDPIWFERYFVPQRELRLAIDGSTKHTVYGGNVKLRKITDIDGKDIEPIF